MQFDELELKQISNKYGIVLANYILMFKYKYKINLEYNLSIEEIKKQIDILKIIQLNENFTEEELNKIYYGVVENKEIFLPKEYLAHEQESIFDYLSINTIKKIFLKAAEEFYNNKKEYINVLCNNFLFLYFYLYNDLETVGWAYKLFEACELKENIKIFIILNVIRSKEEKISYIKKVLKKYVYNSNIYIEEENYLAGLTIDFKNLSEDEVILLINIMKIFFKEKSSFRKNLNMFFNGNSFAKNLLLSKYYTIFEKKKILKYINTPEILLNDLYSEKITELYFNNKKEEASIISLCLKKYIIRKNIICKNFLFKEQNLEVLKLAYEVFSIPQVIKDNYTLIKLYNLTNDDEKIIFLNTIKNKYNINEPRRTRRK